MVHDTSADYLKTGEALPRHPLTLVSHHLCPYVQRAVISLTEKGIEFERIDIDLSHKPDWFLALSPLGKTPVLQVGGAAVFESAAILEYLEETQCNPLHPTDALGRAEHRGWIEFGVVRAQRHCRTLQRQGCVRIRAKDRLAQT